MLHELRIENLLLIERAELRFGAGLNAITGETGAGKTMLAHSLDLLMGGKARPQVVRPGATEAYVEGVFALPDGLLDEPELAEVAERLPDDAEEIVLARRVGESGRTSAFVQGRSASAADLRTIGSRLLAFYGQHEHRRLTLASAQLEVLDGFAGSAQLDRRRRYREVHREALRLGRELEAVRDREGSRERDLDLLRFELEEIEAAAPDADEEEGLVLERATLRHAEALRAAAATALSAFSGEDGEGGASAALAAAESATSAAGGVDPRLDALGERVSSLGIEAADIAAELRAYLDDGDAEPGRLEAVEERLDAIERLKRKHGGSVESVLAHGERCRAEIERLEQGEQRAGELEAALATAEESRAALARELSAARSEAAPGLQERVASELAELAMGGARLDVSLSDHGAGFTQTGSDAVELRLAATPGLEPAPLGEAASGGELSRVMLALSLLGGPGEGTTLVFDEVDAGIGGQTARAVGEKLRRLGSATQVICITHLPQVASLAQTNFVVTKLESGESTRAAVERVEDDELIAEICRMLGSDRTDGAATQHARELLAA